jgi:cytochrome c-type biogenesis protein CcmH/NrfG
VVALALGVTAVAADVEYYFGRTAAAVMLDPLQPKYRAVAGGLEGLRAAAALNDPEPSAWLALGDAEAAAGHADQARAAYQRALELYPFYKDARRRLGLSP